VGSRSLHILIRKGELIMKNGEAHGSFCSCGR
jgi:hypothetical protein